MTHEVVAVVQARIGSSRLPGKVLLEICGEAMLARVVTRVGRARSVDRVLVATSTDPADDVIEEFCLSRGLACSRGSQFDVLDRYYQAARATGAETIVRITADCPVVDPSLIDVVVETLHGKRGALPDLPGPQAVRGLDFVANRLPPPWRRTFPIGLDTEACDFESLERAWHEAREPQEREHVMPYLYEGVELKPVDHELSIGVTPRGFRVGLLDCELDLGGLRWTVDTAEDLEFVRRVFEHFHGRDEFSWKDVLDLVRVQPQLMEINAGVRHKALNDIDERASGLDVQ